jgi:hypothetical protein
MKSEAGRDGAGHCYNNLAECGFALKRWIHKEQARRSTKFRTLQEMQNERAYRSWSSKASRLRCHEVVKSSRLVRIFQDSRRWSLPVRFIRMYCILLLA